MLTASIFQVSDFDLLEGDVYSQEISHLQHKYDTKSVGRVITIKTQPNRHYRLEKNDRTPNGEIAGWWYQEIGGTGRVLIVND